MKPKPPGGLIRETFRHTAVYSGAGMLGRMISFFMLPFYAHILREIGYGVIGMIDASLTLLSSLFAYSFAGAIMRIYHEQSDESRKASVVSTGTLVVAAIVTVLAAFGSVFAVPLSKLILGSGDYAHLIVMTMAQFVVDMVGQTALSLLIIQRRSGLYSLVSLLRLFVGIGLNILLVVILRLDLTGYFLSGLLTSVVSGVVSVTIMLRQCGLGFDREHARTLLAFQMPLIPGSIASFMSRQVERIIVRYQLDLAAVGVLEMAYKFPVLLNILFVEPFMRSWQTTRLQIADEPDAPRRIGDVFTYFLYITILSFLILSVNIRGVLQILTPPEFWDGWIIARVSAAQVVVKGVSMHMSFGLLYAKRTDLMARVMMVIAVFNVPLSYWMITTWGLDGAAWSGLLAAVAALVWSTLLGQRLYRLEFDTWKIIMVVGSGAALLVGIDHVSQETVMRIGSPVLAWMLALGESLRDTWLGEWRNGRLVEILLDRSPYILDVLFRTLCLSAYLLILPLVHVETQRRIVTRLRRQGRRSA